MRIVVIGAGIGGLTAALGLSRQGHDVLVVERDPAPGGGDAEQEFGSWPRSGVPQIRQGHFILGRAQSVLTSHAPDVVDALAEAGISSVPSPMAVLYPEHTRPGDELTPIPTRRIPLELTLRRLVEAEDHAEIRSGASVTGLTMASGDGLPRVTGVRLGDTTLHADYVIDAGGNKSRVNAWLRQDGVVLPDEDVQDSGITYFGRYYRATGEAPDPWALLSSQGASDYLQYVIFPGDRGTYGVVFFVPSWDRDLRALRDDDAFEIAAAAFPSIAPWVDRANAEPINSVDVCAGRDTVIRPFLAEGVPAYLGCLPIGDALCSTDAPLAWGISLAMTHGFAVADAISQHGADPGDVAIAYARSVMEEVDACFRVSATATRIRIRRWRGTYTGPENADEEMEELFLSVAPSAFADPVLLSGFMRRVNLVDPPDALFADPEFMERARAVRESGATASPSGPSRDELLAMLSVDVKV